MNYRTMVTVYAEQNCLSIRTRSRMTHSPQRFIILKKELQRLEEQNYLIVNDIHSFAQLRLCNAAGGEKILEIAFTWLQSNGSNGVSGYTERVRVPYERFGAFASGADSDYDGEQWRMLSIPEQNSPRLEFHSRKNLKAVANNYVLRHKLGKFLAQNFRWYNCERIVLTDDFLPYSFFFESYMVHGTKTCGGVILHGQENLQKARYGIHT